MDKLDKEELAEAFVARLKALARSGGADLRELDREFYGFSVRLGVRYDFAGKFSVSQISGGERAQLHFADVAQFEAHARECLRAASTDAELSEAFMLRLRADPQKAAMNADQIIKFHDFKPFSVQLRCEHCGGSGRRRCKACEGAGKAPCANCGGRGRLICPDCKGAGGYSRAALSSTDAHARGLSAGSASNSMGYRFIPCASCGGSGSRICPACGGTGRLRCEKCGGAGDFRCEHCDGRGYFTRTGKISVYARPSVSIGASSQVFGRELLEFLCSKGVGFAARRLLFRLSSLRAVQGGCEAVFSAEDDFLRLSFAVCGKAYDAACFGGATFVRPSFFDEVFAPELAAAHGAPARLGRDDAQSLFALFRAKPVLDAAMRLASAKLRGETLNLEQLRGADRHFNSVNSTCGTADRDALSLAKDASRKENLKGGASVKFVGMKFASASANPMSAEDNRLGLRGEQGRFAGGVGGGIKFTGADLSESGENSASDFDARQQSSEARAQNGPNFAGSQEGLSDTSDRTAEGLYELRGERDYRDLSVLNAQNSTNSIDSAAINSENLAAAKFKNRTNTQDPAASNSKISPFARLKKFFFSRSLREDCAQSFIAAIMRVCEGFISQQCARDLGSAMAGALGVLSPRYDRAVWCIGEGALIAAATLACEGCFEMIFAEHYFWALACGAVIAAVGLLGGVALWLASAVWCVVKARKIPREYRCGRGGAAFARFCKALLCAVLASAIYGGAANTGYTPKTGAAGLLRGWMPAFFEDENSASASDGVNSADENSTSASS
uniref:zinc finger-like domain-containing protein n=1 Tax=uncultured Campylobacter sp. TaxID=218934 RepID=UPI0026291CDA